MRAEAGTAIRPLAVTAAVMLAALPLAGVAEQAPSTAPPGSAPPESSQDGLTGDWGGLRGRLAARGLRIDLLVIAEGVASLAPGGRRAATVLDEVELKLTLRLQPLVGWTGGTLFLDLLQTNGGDPGALAGSAQELGNIAAPPGPKFEEAWFQQDLLDERLSILLGRYDLNQELYLLRSASLFLNSSFGIGPEFAQSGLAGPSIFPDTSVGGRMGVRLTPAIVARAAVLDGVPVGVVRPGGTTSLFAPGDGLLLAAEADLLVSPRAAPSAGTHPNEPRGRRFRAGRTSLNSAYAGKIAFGGWMYTATFDDLSRVDSAGRPARQRGTGGGYLLAEQAIVREAGGRGITVFGQIGVADPRVNRFALYTGAGVKEQGLIAGRDGDEMGLALAAAHNGDPYLQAQRRYGAGAVRSEWILEWTYLAQVTGWLAVQPDVQWVIHPDTNAARANALAVAIAIEGVL